MNKSAQKTMLFAVMVLSGLSALHAQAFVDIEGGGNVYTFALFHYLTAGVTVRL